MSEYVDGHNVINTEPDSFIVGGRIFRIHANDAGPYGVGENRRTINLPREVALAIAAEIIETMSEGKV